MQQLAQVYNEMTE